MKQSLTLWLTIATVIIVIGGLLMWKAQQIGVPTPSPLPELTFGEADKDPLLAAFGKEQTADNRNLFSGIRPASAEQIQTLFPTIQGQPLLIEFKSKFCLDCKRMAPHIQALLPEFKNVQAQILDIKEDKKQYAPVFEAFQPTIVPILIFVNADGRINNVLYGYQNKDKLAAELRAISQLSVLKE